MASLNTDKNGNRRLQFRAPSGKRATLYLGRLPLRQAETVKSYVERLIIAAVSGDNVDRDTVAWLNRITDELHGKLAAVGLVESRGVATVGTMTAGFLSANDHAKPSTRVVWGHTARNLRKCFGKDRQLRTIGPADAEAFRQFLIAENLADTTITKRIQFGRQMFGYAVQRGWIDTNPLKHVKHRGGDPRKRQHYVTEEETLRLIDAAPNWVWRTIIALARFGGLRTPSETLSLRLADLDWDRGAMTVTSPKTGLRVVPMFARLRPYLEEAWDMAEEGQTHVIPETLYLPAANGPRGWNGCNLRTTFQKIVKRAGLKQWPRLFHNLRASCESDLAREYPIATVCKWIGNTVAIAARHYVQVTDADFDRACCRGEATQNPTHAAHVRRHKAEKDEGQTNPLSRIQIDATPKPDADLQPITGSCDKSLLDNELRRVEPSGLEPPTSWLQTRCSPS